jgi:hypothetical protein
MPIVAQETVLVALILMRRQSLATSDRPADWVLGIGDTLLPLLMRPAGVPDPLSWLGQPLQLVGVPSAALALASLGRSFGLVAANRRIKTWAPIGWCAILPREALRKSLDVLEGVYVERRRGEVGDG